jgi:outer membrane protein assembly factor BamB
MKALLLKLSAAVLQVPLLLLPGHTQGATAVQAWAQRYSGTTGSYDVPCAMACDPAGGVIVALYTGDHFAGGDMLVIKYSNAGVPLWTNRYNGPASEEDYPTAVAVDSSGNVFVTGYSLDSGGYSDFATVAYSGAGVPLWTNRFSGSPTRDDGAEAVATDGSGRVFVAGYSGSSLAAVAYSADGAVLWTNYYNPYTNFAGATAVAVDGDGNVTVAGYAYDSTGRSLCATVAYSGAGTLRWTGLYGKSVTDAASASSLAIDSAGNVFVTGSASAIGSSPDYLTLAYSNTGRPLWTNLYNGPGNSYDNAYGVAVDAASGNVFVTGQSRGVGTGTYDWATIAYSSAGVPLWTNRYTGPGSSVDGASAIAVDSAGSVFVTGGSDDSDGRQCFATAKYSAEGALLWLQEYREPASGSSGAGYLAVDRSGDVFVLGGSMGGGREQNFDCLTICYSGSGVPLWTNRYDGPSNGNDVPSAVAVDAVGNIFITGYSVGSGGAQDYLTLAFTGTGVPLWTNRYSSPGYAFDQATALAVDDLGNVFVTGSAGTTNWDYTTIAYSGAGVGLWTNAYNGTGNGSDKAIGVAVGRGGRVFVTGNAIAAGGSSEVATLAYSTAGAALWTNHYAGGLTTSAEALAADRYGNVFVAVSFMGTNGAYDFATLGYSGDGVPLWTNVYASPDNSEDYARAIAVGADGRVFVAGYSGADSVTIAYSGEGLPLWTNRARASWDSSDRAGAVAVDGSGNVFVAGYSYSYAAGTSYDYVVAAYSAAGVPLWTNRYNGPGNGDDRATAVAVDAGGNVFVTGYSPGAAGSADFLTIAYSNGGVPLWTNRYDGPAGGSDKPSNWQCLAIDRSGSVIVVGSSDGDYSSFTTYDYAVVKYVSPPAIVGFAPSGSSGWRLSCSAMPGLPYVTQFATNLTSSPWFNLCTNAADSAGLWSATDFTASAQRFYRVVSSR